MRTQLLTALLLASVPVFGADREFDHIVKAIETHYGVKRMHIPLMGVANLFVKVARPAGASSVKVAIFEDLKASREDRDPAELDRIFDALSAGAMRPMVRVHSRHGESTYICTGDAGKSTRLLIVNFERNQATVVAATVDMETFVKTIESPEHVTQMFGVKHGDW